VLVLLLITKENHNFEDHQYFEKNKFLAGVDEVGRGALAGPVVGACALLAPCEKKKAIATFSELSNLGLTDSKKLSHKKRLRIFTDLELVIAGVRPKKLILPRVKDYGRLKIVVCEVTHTSIDKINILNASLMAMGSAFKCLWDGVGSGRLLIDGQQKINLEHQLVQEIPLIKGDARSLLIALASVAAKEYRDLLMVKYAHKYPHHGFEQHAGYPTARHKMALDKFGVLPIHRKTFKGVKELC